jgi:hypothetical protein
VFTLAPRIALPSSLGGRTQNASLPRGGAALSCAFSCHFALGAPIHTGRAVAVNFSLGGAKDLNLSFVLTSADGTSGAGTRA